MHRHKLAAEAGDPHAGGAQRKRQRAAIFAEWLLATFGREALNQGSGMFLYKYLQRCISVLWMLNLKPQQVVNKAISCVSYTPAVLCKQVGSHCQDMASEVRAYAAVAGVLDIAGGSGSLSFCLQTVHGVRCTTIDPRPAKLSKEAHRHLARLRAQGGGAAGGGGGDSLLESELDSPHDSLWGCLEQNLACRAADTSTSGVPSELLAEPDSRCNIVERSKAQQVHVAGNSNV